MDDQRTDRENRVMGCLAFCISAGLAFGAGFWLGWSSHSLAADDARVVREQLLQRQHEEEINQLKSQQK